MTKTPEPQRERFTLTLEALPDQVPVAVRLRRVLKIALRAFRLRCTRIEPTDQAPGDAAGRSAREIAPPSRSSDLAR